MSDGARYSVNFDELIEGARVPAAQQVEQQAEPRLHQPLAWTPNVPADGGAPGDGDGE